MTTYVKTDKTNYKNYIVINEDKVIFYSIDNLGRRSEEKTENINRINFDMIKKLGYKLEG